MRSLNISNLLVGGDSKCVIDWLNKKAYLQVLNLSYWEAKVEGLLKEFQSLSFSHVHKEFNHQVDVVSKKGLLLLAGSLQLQEWREGQHICLGIVQIF